MNHSEKTSQIRKKNISLKNRVNELELQLASEKQEKGELIQKLEELRKRSEKLEETNKIIKLADGIQLNKPDISEIKHSIDRYVKEIDECLMLLNHLTDNN